MSQPKLSEMRRALTIFTPLNGGACELLFDYRTHFLEQKKRIKELVHEGHSVGGIAEFLTSDNDRIVYKIPPLKQSVLPEPVAKQSPQKKKLLV